MPCGCSGGGGHGHAGGSINPIFVPEHFGPRNSQHLFDSYTFVHITHGVLSYFIWSWVAAIFQFTPFWSGYGGLIVALMGALLWEGFENTDEIINKFRETSGASEDYRGDSAINVLGDLLGCAVGYNVTKFFAFIGAPLIPIFYVVVTEVYLAFKIRDNLTLLVMQFVYPVDKIRTWQKEIIDHVKREEEERKQLEEKREKTMQENIHFKNREFVPRRFNKYYAFTRFSL